MPLPTVESIEQLIGVAQRLGALIARELSAGERKLIGHAAPVEPSVVRAFRDSIEQRDDPLGFNFTRLNDPAARRPLGATYTPKPLVELMTQWVVANEPVRVVDPGAGSGRFIVAAGRALPKARLVAIEADPLAALLLRAHLNAAGLRRRSQIIVADYCRVHLGKCRGRTAFVGNPPYVRHHGILAEDKRWFAEAARTFGISASKLAGLHLYFYIATAQKSAPGDVGSFVTASEWLDVNYGALLRGLMLGPLGLRSLDVIDPSALPFEGALTTAVVSCFQVGQRQQKIRMRKVATLARLEQIGEGRELGRERFECCERWSTLLKSRPSRAAGHVELGELCRVHRGQVTGNNRVWIAGAHSAEVPAEYLFSAVTHASELFAAGAELSSTQALSLVIDIPPDLAGIAKRHRAAIERFLDRARAMGGDRGYVASHRRAWWSVGLREPAPILASYMARRSPAFVRNSACVRHINIAHGIYPRDAMSSRLLDVLAAYLRRSVLANEGRTYAGGLAKFEPKEMERLLVPGPPLLLAAE